MTDESSETRFTTTMTHVGDAEELATWEAEQRATLERTGVTDFEVTYGDRSVTVAYNFTVPPKDSES